jgi:hypothetical protein
MSSEVHGDHEETLRYLIGTLGTREHFGGHGPRNRLDDAHERLDGLRGDHRFRQLACAGGKCAEFARESRHAARAFSSSGRSERSARPAERRYRSRRRAIDTAQAAFLTGRHGLQRHPQHVRDDAVCPVPFPLVVRPVTGR